MRDGKIVNDYVQALRSPDSGGASNNSSSSEALAYSTVSTQATERTLSSAEMHRSPSQETPLKNKTTQTITGSPESWSEHLGKRAPNWLTFLRLLLVPVFVLLLMSPPPASTIWATSVFVFASFTDWLDGYIARLYQAESILGTLLDPLADKVLVMSALVMLSAIQPEPRIPAWIVVILLAREMLVTGLRSVAALQGNVVAASTVAKYKTATQMAAIFCLLLWEPYPVLGFMVNFASIGTIILWIALGLSIISGAQYAIDLRKVFR